LVEGFNSYSFPKNFRLKSRLEIINDQSFLAQMSVFLENSQAAFSKQELKFQPNYNPCSRLYTMFLLLYS
jgi:hypothetical protein